VREALADFDHILRFDRQNPIALFNRGMALQQLGEREASRASLSEACKLGMGPACEALSR
jgi:Flp pilus assembly protein TadD